MRGALSNPRYSSSRLWPLYVAPLALLTLMVAIGAAIKAAAGTRHQYIKAYVPPLRRSPERHYGNTTSTSGSATGEDVWGDTGAWPTITWPCASSPENQAGTPAPQTAAPSGGCSKSGTPTPQTAISTTRSSTSRLQHSYGVD